MRSSILVAAAATTALAFELGGVAVPRHPPRRSVAIRCCDVPSDLDLDSGLDEPYPSSAFPLEPGSEPEVVAQDAGASERARIKTQLLSLAAGSVRGESATPADLATARELVSLLEALNPTPKPTMAPGCAGTWELAFADTQLFRSSPFFMAGRAVCAEGAEADRYDWFCDMHRAALAISTIGKVRQVVDGERVVSEFEVTVGAVPFLADVPLIGPRLAYSGGLPVAIMGSIVSTASVEENLGDGWTLLMDTVEVKGSNVPLLRQALDAGVRLPTRQLGRAIQTVSSSYANPTPVFRTTYLDDTLRISRDQVCDAQAHASGPCRWPPE